ncbi:cytochrome c-type biogenesis protein CcmH [Lysobacter humi (ex Lee et al. 2017)]
MRALLLALCLLATSLSASAQVVDRRPIEFRDRVEERRFQSLTHELRCVMCQNQSIADSDALIAVDLRHEILELMRDGRSDQEIRDYLVARYGEFVLYRPQVGPATWALWFGPLLLLAAGGWLVWRLAARSSAGVPSPAADEDAPPENW